MDQSDPCHIIIFILVDFLVSGEKPKAIENIQKILQTIFVQTSRVKHLCCPHRDNPDLSRWIPFLPFPYHIVNFHFHSSGSDCKIEHMIEKVTRLWSGFTADVALIMVPLCHQLDGGTSPIKLKFGDKSLQRWDSSWTIPIIFMWALWWRSRHLLHILH